MQEVFLDLDTKVVSSIDSFNARGMVNIKVLDRDGNIVETIKNHNLIVKIGRSELIKKIAGTSVLSGITKCAVGSGGAAAGTPFVPVAPVDGDTALYAKTCIKNIGTSTVDTTQTNPQVTFTTLFSAAEVNSLVNECGLFFSDGTTMFSRYTFKTVSLDSASGFSIEIDWIIQF